MSRLFRLSGAIKRDDAVDAWFGQRDEGLAAIARRWFDVMRGCGRDVKEILHDGHPTACVGDAAFGYVNAFTSHVNVGFFVGPELSDPANLLQGTGKFMRHVKLRPGSAIDADALTKLIGAAYTEIKNREET